MEHFKLEIDSSGKHKTILVSCGTLNQEETKYCFTAEYFDKIIHFNKIIHSNNFGTDKVQRILYNC